MPESNYRIDYDNLDVQELMRQVRAHAQQQDLLDPAPALDRAGAHARLQEYLGLDNDRPYELQRALALPDNWNLGPEDLQVSHPGPMGRLIRGIRTLLRPALKLLANADLPLYKQFKINVGLAAALSDLLEDNARLRKHLGQLSRRLERLESMAAAGDAADAEDR